MITGVNHITLSVGNLANSIAFYRDVLELQLRAKWPRGAYFAAGDLWLALILDSRIRASPLSEYTHIAFTVSVENFDALSDRIQQYGAEIWQDNSSEGASLYFLDPDGHKLEIHASDLTTRLQTALTNPWEGLEIFA